jgi:hypothetical protein
MINDHSFKPLAHLRLSTYYCLSTVHSVVTDPVKTSFCRKPQTFNGVLRTRSTPELGVPVLVLYRSSRSTVPYTGVRSASRVCQAKILLHSTSEPPNQNAKKNLVRDAKLKRCSAAALCKCMLCTRSTEYSEVRVIEIESSTTSLET